MDIMLYIGLKFINQFLKECYLSSYVDIILYTLIESYTWLICGKKAALQIG